MRIRTASAFALSLALAGTALAGGFRLEGEKLEDLKLVFDSTGMDRTTPEGTARALIDTKLSVSADPAMQAKYEKARLAHAAARLADVLTPEAIQTAIGREQKSAADLEAVAGKGAPAKVEFTRKDVRAEDATLDYSASYTRRFPCTCDAQKRAGCERCKGSGVQAKDVTDKGRIVMKKVGEVWLVQEILRPCWRCAEKEPVNCTNCKGTGMVEDNFLRGPRPLDGEPDLTLPKADLSTAEGAFDAFAAALRVLRLQEALSENRLVHGFEQFRKFLVAEGAGGAAEKKHVTPVVLKRMERAKGDTDAVAIFPYSSVREKASDSVDGRVVLTRVDGRWRVSEFQQPCYMCKMQGCDKCKKRGFNVSDHLPW